MRISALLAGLVICLQAACKEGTTESPPPVNHHPVITSVVTFPEIVRPSDSLIVVCNAYDPDGDSLFYDWYSSGIVRIRGALPGLPALFHTRENTRVFYSPDSMYVTAPLDSFRLECAVRDGKGGMAVRAIYFVVGRMQ